MRTQKVRVLVAPVGVVWEGHIHICGVAVVAKHWGSLLACICAQHAWEVTGLQHSVQIWHLRAPAQSDAHHGSLCLQNTA